MKSRIAGIVIMALGALSLHAADDYVAITNAPVYADLVNLDLRQRSFSPCVNAGTNFSWMTDGFDLDGNKRIDPSFGVVDMGCYEHQFTGTAIIVQ